MREHIQGAVQFVSNNRLKFDRPAQPIEALPDPGQTFGYVNKEVPQPSPKEVLAKLDTPEIKERCADLLSRYPVGRAKSIWPRLFPGGLLRW